MPEYRIQNAGPSSTAQLLATLSPALAAHYVVFCPFVNITAYTCPPPLRNRTWFILVGYKNIWITVKNIWPIGAAQCRAENECHPPVPTLGSCGRGHGGGNHVTADTASTSSDHVTYRHSLLRTTEHSEDHGSSAKFVLQTNS